MSRLAHGDCSVVDTSAELQPRESASRRAEGQSNAQFSHVRSLVPHALAEERRTTYVPRNADDVVEATLGPIRSMATLLNDSTASIERRREVLRRLLPAGPNGERPIRVEFDLTAGRGWRRAFKRATVRHLSVRNKTKVESVVAGAVAAEGELREGEEELDLVDVLAAGARDLFPEEVFEVEFDESAHFEGVENEAEPVVV